MQHKMKINSIERDYMIKRCTHFRFGGEIYFVPSREVDKG